MELILPEQKIEESLSFHSIPLVKQFLGGWRAYSFIEEVPPEIFKLSERLLGQQSMRVLSRKETASYGRGLVEHVRLSSGQHAVIRVYRRGGIFSRLVKDVFFCLPWYSYDALRPVRELRILKTLSAKGVSVPRPILSLTRRVVPGFVYRGFLVTEEIIGAKNLLELVYEVKDDEKRKEELDRISYLAGLEAGKALALGIYHPDLHLGNVLTAEGKVFLIDFDKADRFRPVDFTQRRTRLIGRWKRSSSKHGVAHYTVLGFCRGVDEGLKSQASSE